MVAEVRPKEYSANVTAGALLVPESRKIADLLLSDVSKDQWKDAVLNQYILQKRSHETARRVANLIRSRLVLMQPALWELVRDGDAEVSKHAVFAAAIKHCPLLGDYLDLVVRGQFQRMEEQLSQRLWDEFIQDCMQRDPDMPDFPETTARKVRTNIHKILYEAGVIKDRRSMSLQRVDIAPEVSQYPKEYHEDYVLKCIQV